MPESKGRKAKRGRPRTQSPIVAAVRVKAPSPTWFVVVMAGLMALGVILVLLRFIFNLDQWLLIAGLAAIAGGFLMTTSYR
jgi:uncharacterized membrane protein HdeD (DUF308 family)